MASKIKPCEVSSVCYVNREMPVLSSGISRPFNL